MKIKIRKKVAATNKYIIGAVKPNPINPGDVIH